MKRAVILHGTGNSPSDDWHPWLNEVLAQHGFSVLHPLLPNNTHPDREVYNDFLFGQNWEFGDNVMFGHSSGATSIFNFLMDGRAPHIKAAVLIASFTELSPAIIDSEWYQPGQFDNLFPPDGFDWEHIRRKCSAFYFVHGSNDPYCSIEVARQVSDILNGKFVVVPNGHHLGSSSGIIELTQMLEALESDSIL